VPRALFALLVVAVTVSAIGGGWFVFRTLGGDSAEDLDATPSTTQEPGIDTAPAETAETGETPESEEPSEQSSFCVSYAELQEAGLAADDLDDPAAMGEVAASYADLRDVAPADIKDDVGVIADFFEAMSDPRSLVGSRATSPEQVKKYGDATSKVTTYYADHCV